MAAELAERIGARMRERREELGLTQGAVADRIPKSSVDGNVISRWERAVATPNDEHLELIATALETTVADLASGPKADRAKLATPDLLGARNGSVSQLDRIEAMLKELVAASRSREELDDAAERMVRALEQSGLAPPQAPPADGEEPPEAEAAGA